MTCEKCFISTNILEGCNLTQHGSKRQIKMFMVRFTLGKNLSLVWHVKSVSSQPTFWKVVTWHNMVPKDKFKCSWLDSLWGKFFHLYDMWKVFNSQPTFEDFWGFNMLLSWAQRCGAEVWPLCWAQLSSAQLRIFAVCLDTTSHDHWSKKIMQKKVSSKFTNSDVYFLSPDPILTLTPLIWWFIIVAEYRTWVTHLTID